MPEALRETAYAKINLALHVRARRPDGYHELETLFAFAEDGDSLTVEPASNLSLTISGPQAQILGDPEGNLVMRAAIALRDAFGSSDGAALSLFKRLPVASGLGGGSADAAAALRLLSRLWGLQAGDERIDAIARDLGADVPACLASHTCFGTGRGDALAPVDLPGLAGTPVLIVNPGHALATGPVFKAWDGVDRGALDPRQWRTGRNDLTAPAIGLIAEIGTVIERLERQSGANFVAMSGSGASCFALFDDEASRDAAARAMSDYWVMPTRLR
jgi:4-diphosphocytidyl-2-C-methyl-D-erythritol kinase